MRLPTYDKPRVIGCAEEYPHVVRRILERIAAGSSERCDQALAELFIVAELRKITGDVKREVEKMPILPRYYG